MRYSGGKCPVCEVEFDNNSDIVVCPDCGTPHHRECWAKAGSCANSELHKSGFVYVHPVREEKRSDETDAETVIHGTDGGGGVFSGENSHSNPTPAAYGFFNSEPIMPETDIGGISGKDYGLFLGSAAFRYLPRFLFIQKTGKKTIINLFAFLLPFTFAAYKRMYKLAAVLLTLNMLFFAVGIYGAMNKEPLRAVWEVTVQIAADSNVTEEEYELFKNALNKASQTEVKATWTDYVLQLKIADNIFTGLFATYLYMKESEKKIKSLRDADMPEEVYGSLLRRLGRGALTLPLMGYIAIFFEVTAILGYGLNL